jgi:hypothetical protein
VITRPCEKLVLKKKSMVLKTYCVACLGLGGKALKQVQTSQAIRLVETDMVFKLVLLRETGNIIMEVE